MRGCGAQPQPAFRESAEPVEQEEERDDKASNGCCSLLLQCGDSVPHLLTDRPDGWGGAREREDKHGEKAGLALRSTIWDGGGATE